MLRILLSAAIAIVVFAIGLESAQRPEREARMYLQQALDTLKNHALYPKETDWKTLSEQSFLRAEHARIPSDTYPAIIYACAQLRKREQCFFTVPDSTASDVRKNVADAVVANSPPVRQSMPLKPSPFTGRKEPQLAMLQGPKGKVWAYLVVPQCKPPYADIGKNEPFLAAWTAALRFFIIEGYGAHGWIVDLRGNEGGNTWTAVAALGPLLGEGSLGAFVVDGTRESWFYRKGQAGLQIIGNNNFTNDVTTKDLVQQSIGGPHVDLSSAPVAVLFDNATAGSGEQIAIAFAGRDKERSFGLPTEGYAGCCTRYRLSDGAFINMEMGIVEDRRGRVYPEGAKPDERVETGTGGLDLASDPVIQAASGWLSTMQ